MDTRRFLCDDRDAPQPNQENHKQPPLSKTDLYLKHLHEEGFNPQVDEDGDVIFRCESRTYVLIQDERDPTFVRLLLPNFWAIESEEEHLRALMTANQVNAKMKIVKLVMVRRSVWASIELLIDSPAHFVNVFNRCVQIIPDPTREFRQAMQQLSDE